jgi:ElaB/YqjD/DUF883 family membrane-anchored ribosome-binding protein
MDNETEALVIRQQMEETRTSLQDKLETLEQQVKDTVQGAAEAANETVQTVKEAVQDTVDTMRDTVEDTVTSVKDTFDLHKQVAAHPWAMFLGAAVVGYVGTRMLSGGGTASPPPPAVSGPKTMAGGYRPNGAGATPASPQSSGFLARLAEHYKDELNKVQSLAVGVAAGILREMLTSSAPPALVDQIKDIVDGVTSKLGGKPVQGPIFKENETKEPTWKSRFDEPNNVEPLTP